MFEGHYRVSFFQSGRCFVFFSVQKAVISEAIGVTEVGLSLIHFVKMLCHIS